MKEKKFCQLIATYTKLFCPYLCNLINYTCMYLYIDGDFLAYLKTLTEELWGHFKAKQHISKHIRFHLFNWRTREGIFLKHSNGEVNLIAIAIFFLFLFKIASSFLCEISLTVLVHRYIWKGVVDETINFLNLNH